MFFLGAFHLIALRTLTFRCAPLARNAMKCNFEHFSAVVSNWNKNP